MKLYYTTEEVAGHFDVAPSKIRYYVSEFGLKINKNGKNSAFSMKDMEDLADLIFLMEVEKYTLEGAKIKFKKKSSLKRKNEALLLRLKGIKEILEKLKGTSGE